MDIKISILNEFNKEVSTYITDLDSYELSKKHNISIQDKIDEMIHKVYFNQVSENNQTEDLVKIPNGDDFFLSEKEETLKELNIIDALCIIRSGCSNDNERELYDIAFDIIVKEGKRLKLIYEKKIIEDKLQKN
jgi:hypothetical protein